jgi:hypothetical protein
MSITPEAIQSLIWKRQSKAGCGLGTYCKDSDRFLSELGNIAIPPPAQKTFDAEGISRSSLEAKRDSIRGGR